MKTARWAVAIIGILLPYLSRLPGLASHGSWWLTSYFGDNIFGFVFFQAFNAITWVALLKLTSNYQHPRSLVIPAVLAYSVPLWLHSGVDLRADAQAAIALIIIPFYALPGAWIGSMIGRWYDKRLASGSNS